MRHKRALSYDFCSSTLPVLADPPTTPLHSVSFDGCSRDPSAAHPPYAQLVLTNMDNQSRGRFFAQANDPVRPGREYFLKGISSYDETNEHYRHLLREIHLLSRLAPPGVQIPGIIRHFGPENTSSQLLLWLERGGKDLYASYYVKNGVLPSLGTVRQIMRQVSQGLLYCHKHGVVHQDVKPENILIAPDPQGRRGPNGQVLLTAKLIDFGLSVRRTTLNYINWSRQQRRDYFTLSSYRQAYLDIRPGEMRGTSMYLSPEALTGLPLLGPGMDWWALGIIYYELLAGYHPWDCEGGEMLPCDLDLETIVPDFRLNSWTFRTFTDDEIHIFYHTLRDYDSWQQRWRENPHTPVHRRIGASLKILRGLFHPDPASRHPPSLAPDRRYKRRRKVSHQAAAAATVMPQPVLLPDPVSVPSASSD